MFGFSKREILVKVIKNACANELACYDDGVKKFTEAYKTNPEMPEKQLDEFARVARCNYLNAVCDSVWNSFAVSSPSVHAQFRLALTNPQITGLASKFDVDYLCKNGISAGVTFAFAYFALTGKSVATIKLSKTMSMLNHYQNDLMDSVLLKYDTP